MSSLEIYTEITDSFRDCWNTFRGRLRAAVGEHPLSAEEEAELLTTQKALLERFQLLKDSDLGSDIPSKLSEAILYIGQITTYRSLSDAQLDGCRQSAQTAEELIDEWFVGLRRKGVYRNNLARKVLRQFQRRWLMVPAIFLGLVVLLLVVGIRVFLNR